MIEARRVRPPSKLSARVLRIGAGLGPSDDCANPFLPFRDNVFQHIICRYVLHLYLSIVELFVTEAHRVLVPGGDLTIRVPDWGSSASTSNIAHIAELLVDGGFSLVDLGEAPNEDYSLWDDIYRGCGYELKAEKRGSAPSL